MCRLTPVTNCRGEAGSLTDVRSRCRVINAARSSACARVVEGEVRPSSGCVAHIVTVPDPFRGERAAEGDEIFELGRSAAVRTMPDHPFISLLERKIPRGMSDAPRNRFSVRCNRAPIGIFATDAVAFRAG